jgi:hypothetical protein
MSQNWTVSQNCKCRASSLPQNTKRKNCPPRLLARGEIPNRTNSTTDGHR